MTSGYVQDLGAFFVELQRETDRGLPLVAAALIDEKLLASLQAFLCAGKTSDRLLIDPNAPLGTFSARIDACFALALIDEHEYREITLIRKIRNRFAHSKHGISFKDEKVAGLCASLESQLPSGEHYNSASARVRFINSTVCIALRLLHRDKWVQRERRVLRTWVKPEEIGWRSFKDETPPPGSAYVAFGPAGPEVHEKKA
jgi:hypothetical protein